MKRIAVGAAGAAALLTLAACGSSSSDAAAPVAAASARSSIPTVGPVTPSATPSPKPASIPLRVVKEAGEALVLAPVTVKGKEYAFIVDTGASVTLVSESFAKEAGLEPNGKTLPITGIGGGSAARLADVSGWSLGKAELPTITVGIGISTFSPTAKIAGLLGSDVLSTFGKVTIDYSAAKAYLG